VAVADSHAVIPQRRAGEIEADGKGRARAVVHAQHPAHLSPHGGPGIGKTIVVARQVMDADLQPTVRAIRSETPNRLPELPMILVGLELGENLRDLASKRIIRDILADRIGRAHMVVRSEEPARRPMQFEDVAGKHQMHLRGLPPSRGLPNPRDKPLEGGRLDIAPHTDLLELAVRPVADAVKPRFLNMQIADNRKHTRLREPRRRSLLTPISRRHTPTPVPGSLNLPRRLAGPALSPDSRGRANRASVEPRFAASARTDHGIR